MTISSECVFFLQKITPDPGWPYSIGCGVPRHISIVCWSRPFVIEKMAQNSGGSFNVALIKTGPTLNNTPLLRLFLTNFAAYKLFKVWSWLEIGLLIFAMILTTVFYVIYPALFQPSMREITLRVIVSVGFIFQCASVLFSLNRVSKYSSFTTAEWVSVLDTSKNIIKSTVLFSLLLITGFAFPVAVLLHAKSNLEIFFYLENTLTSFCSACILSSNYVFMLSDTDKIREYMAEFQQLFALRNLTVERYQSTVQDVKEMVHKHNAINSLVLLIGIFNLIVVVVALFLINTKKDGYLYVITLLLVFIRELPFVLMILWESATINELVYKFNKHVANTIPKLKSTMSSFGGAEEKILLFIAMQGEDCSFPCCGVKLRPKDFWWRMISWVLAFLLGILKSTVFSEV